MKRKIIEIDQSLCNGCGLCIDACHEGAIELVNGKAQLVSDEYCDGLGDCLPECPTGAIELIEREAKPFDEALVQEKIRQEESHCTPSCPGLREFVQETTLQATRQPDETPGAPSALGQWPIQLQLVNPNASYFDNAHLLVAADCVAFALGDFHREFLDGKTLVIGCPKLDDLRFYEEKLTQIMTNNNLQSITALRMEVPCCGGIITAVRNAMLNSQTIVPYQEFTITTNGTVKPQEAARKEAQNL